MENNDCGKCGKCCEVIWLRYSKKYLKEFYPENKDSKFVLENWEEITIDDFKKENPYFFSHIKKMIENGVIPNEELSGTYYRCTKFDKEKRLCSVHENRPDICRNFPFYPRNTDNKIIDGDRMLHPTFSLYSDKCIFNKALATNEQWEKS